MHVSLNNSSFLKSTSAKSLRRVREPKLNSAHETGEAVGDGDEKCPVIRAHQVFITGNSAGRLRVVFF